jgi:hypothetical protein
MPSTKSQINLNYQGSKSQPPHPLPLPCGDCVTIAKMMKNVMLNLFQHLMDSISCETLKRVQGDNK